MYSIGIIFNSTGGTGAPYTHTETRVHTALRLYRSAPYRDSCTHSSAAAAGPPAASVLRSIGMGETVGGVVGAGARRVEEGLVSVHRAS